MNAINISEFEDRFLGMVQRNLNMFSRKTTPIQVVHKKPARSKITRLKEEIISIQRQVVDLENKKRRLERELKEEIAALD